MTSSGNSFLASTNAVFVCDSDEEERHALEALTDLLVNDADAWSSTAVDNYEPVGLIGRLLVYTFARAFASLSSLASVFREDALATAETIPALTRPADLASSAQQLLAQLQQTQWSPAVLGKLNHILQQIEDPRVRQQAIQFSYGVLQKRNEDAVTEDWSREASQILLLGVTDVWSAVRKQSARSVVEIVLQFPALYQIDSFIGSLLKIAGGEEWKAQEGALLALTAIVASIETESTPPATTLQNPAQPSVRAADMIRGGANASAPDYAIVYHLGDHHRGLPHLPRSLPLKLKPTLYAALKNAQLSVRDASAQCMVYHMEICDEATRVLTFQEVMSKLNRLAPEPAAASSTSVELLDAAEAEGLLDVLARLVPQLPDAFLVKHWKLVFPTLERYVMHIASTVRIRSSSVVLALAALSLSENVVATTQSIELLYHMLLALAERRLDVGVCWQRLEGRLLSVELLVGLLGKDHLWRMGAQQNLLHFVSEARPPRSISVDGWLPVAMVTQATWTLDEVDEHRFQNVAMAGSSMIQRLEAFAKKKNLSSSEMWRDILGGWLQQTYEAFVSTRFELRRIARQVLPGLVRLCLWCDQLQLLEFVSTKADTKLTALGQSPPLNAWTWVCLRHAVLHTRLVFESTAQHDWITTISTLVPDVLKRANLAAATSQDEPEAVVARVEAVLLATLSQRDPLPLVPIACVLGDVHHNLPASFQHPLVSVSPSPDGSLDRQFSTALVTLLPVLVRRIVLVVEDLQLWRTIERVVLSWLATDDMFRWITIDKQTAQASLLLALRELLACPIVEGVITPEEVTLIVRTLENVVPMLTSRHQRVMESVSDSLVRIYTSLWRLTDAEGIHQKLLTTLAMLHFQRCQVGAAVKSTTLGSDWDNWDGEEASESLPKDREDGDLRPTSLSNDGEAVSARSVASVVTCLLSPEQIDSLVAALYRLVNDDDAADHHHRDAVYSFAAAVESLRLAT